MALVQFTLTSITSASATASELSGTRSFLAALGVAAEWSFAVLLGKMLQKANKILKYHCICISIYSPCLPLKERVSVLKVKLHYAY